MSLQKDDVYNIAHLARIEIDASKVGDYVNNLGNILDLVGHLEEADTNNIEPMAHPLDTSQPLRTDEVTETDHRDNYQAIAPSTEQGLYLVPKVIE